MKYICVIGDVIGSRAVGQRAVLQRQLQGSLGKLNRGRDKALASPWTITLGDEFQAVYRDGSSLFSDVVWVLHDIYPVRARFSIAVGELSTPLNKKRAIGMDGPAFHAARAGLEELKHSHSILRVTETKDGSPPWINLTLDLIAHESKTWKKIRLFVFHRLLDGYDAKVIAAEAGVSSAAVYKNIGSGALWTIKALLQEITTWMNSQRAP